MCFKNINTHKQVTTSVYTLVEANATPIDCVQHVIDRDQHKIYIKNIYFVCIILFIHLFMYIYNIYIHKHVSTRVHTRVEQ